MADPPNRYVLITPCRDEAEFARRTLDSVIAQTVKPAKWVIVDDGSKDDTPNILAEYAAKHDWITVVRKEDRGKRAVGPGVIEAFYHGYETINIDDYDFICKLDLDLDIPHGYFETLINRMHENPRIGTCSGKPYFIDRNGNLEPEPCGDENSVGAMKFYRVACFKQIGGFVRQVMWDGIDCHRCRMLGWIPIAWDDAPELRVTHLRPMGSSSHGILAGRRRHGFGQYFMGTSLLYVTASAVHRIFTPPVVLGSMMVWWGYVRSWIKGLPRYDDPEFRAFVRRYQRLSLTMGKQRANQHIIKERSTHWKPDATATPDPAMP